MWPPEPDLGGVKGTEKRAEDSASLADGGCTNGESGNDRELPGLLAVLACIKEPLSLVVIDGDVWSADGKPGLGTRLYERPGREIAVVGVAKKPFAGPVPAVAIHRGASRQPLFVTSVGVDLEQAGRWVRDLSGEHRIPDVLKRVDRLARSGMVMPGQQNDVGTAKRGAPTPERTQGPPLHIRLGRAEVEKLLKGAGLDVVRSEDFGGNFYIVQGRTRK